MYTTAYENNLKNAWPKFSEDEQREILKALEE